MICVSQEKTQFVRVYVCEMMVNQIVGVEMKSNKNKTRIAFCERLLASGVRQI